MQEKNILNINFNMKKLLFTLFSLLALSTAKAQVYVDGDLNKDGTVSVSDLTAMVNLLNGKENVKSPEELIAGKWQTAAGDVMKLNEDGTTDYKGSASFLYKIKERNIYMYDVNGEIVHLFNVVNICSAYMVLKELGQQEKNIYYNEFLVEHPFVKPEQDNTDDTHGDPFNGHEYVDLGLSVKWATCNVGADSPEDFGNYYAWGDTVPQIDNEYSWNSYKFCDGTAYTMNKYCDNPGFGVFDKKNVLELEDDVAHVCWGGKWRMPTKNEMTELAHFCTWTYTTHNGIKGFTVTGKNGNSIFLPAAGFCNYGHSVYVGEEGQYWSSSLYGDYSNYAYRIHIQSQSGGFGFYMEYRNYGCSVRAVCP